VLHLTLPRLSRNNHGHRAPSKFIGSVKVVHPIDPEANVLVRDEDDRDMLLTEVHVDLWSDSMNGQDVTVELIGRRTTKSLKADLRSVPDTITVAHDDVVTILCRELNISTDPHDLIAQAFPKS
jgi:hypothetical protein